MEKEMATHSSILAWRIPGTAEPGGLLSMGLHRVRHDWSDLAAAAAAVCYIVSQVNKQCVIINWSSCFNQMSLVFTKCPFSLLGALPG